MHPVNHTSCAFFDGNYHYHGTSPATTAATTTVLSAATITIPLLSQATNTATTDEHSYHNTAATNTATTAVTTFEQSY